jgi:riboflavin synthase
VSGLGGKAAVFTGIIKDIGTVIALQPRGGDLCLRIAPQTMDLAHTQLGDSIAVSGVCLTVTALAAGSFEADVSRETLALTTLARWQVGQRVNLEPALRVGDALGGHWVSGHVDGVAEVIERSADARSERLKLRVPVALVRYLARKGSVTLDGVSLTINAASGDTIDVNLVPHTLTVTTLSGWKSGMQVNLEVDVIARYAERLLATMSTQ